MLIRTSTIILLFEILCDAFLKYKGQGIINKVISLKTGIIQVMDTRTIMGSMWLSHFEWFLLKDPELPIPFFFIGSTIINFWLCNTRFV